MCLICGDIVCVFSGLADGVKTGQQTLTRDVINMEGDPEG